MKLFTSKTQKTGEIGEDEAVKYLKNKGYSIVERNYTRKWGEIDIIARKDNVTHFVEVKSISQKDNVSYETLRPEENMTTKKVESLRRTIDTYLFDLSKGLNETTEWQFDLVCVYLNEKGNKVEIMEDLIL